MTEPMLEPDDLRDEFESVVVAAPDVQGRLFGRRLPVDAFLATIDDGVDVCTAVLSWDIDQNPMGMVGRLDWAGFHTGWHDLGLVADLGTLRPAAWLDGVAICLADCVEVADRSPVAVSPRAILRAQVEALAEGATCALVGTELEFYLYRRTPEENRSDRFAALDPTTAQPADYSIMQGDRYEPFFADVRRRLRDSGIVVDAAQGEWGLGQWEMPLHCADPVTAADNHALYKMALRGMAAGAGMTATFMARPASDQPGSSCHLHLSLQDAEGTHLFWDADADHDMSQTMRHALGGVVDRTDDLMAWYAPTVNSYRRLVQQDFAGWGRTWGLDNRTTSYRIVGHAPSRLRIESRLPGADANPYLAVAAMLASARAGITEAIEPGDPIVGNAYEEQEATGMPEHLGAAVARFADSPFCRATFGGATVEHYAAHGDAEWQASLREVTDWERLRYLELI